MVDKAGYTTRQGVPDETFVTQYFYTGLSTRIVLDGQRQAYRTYNALNQLIETIDTAGQRTKYRYDGAGRAILIENSQGHQIRTGYNAQGHKTFTDDPDRGRWAFVSNGLSELLSQTDANGSVVEYRYDLLGRAQERTVNQKIDATWTYDGPGARGLLSREASLDPRTGQPVFLRELTYDDPALRPTNSIVSFDGRTYEVKTAYHCSGQPRGVEIPQRRSRRVSLHTLRVPRAGDRPALTPTDSGVPPSARNDPVRPGLT